MENRVRNGNIAGYKRCAFTGYRPQKMPWGENENCPECVEYKALLAEKIEQLIEQGYGHFISGGAMGMVVGVPARDICSNPVNAVHAKE